MTLDLFATAARLRAEGTPFVWATVVASYPPQSVRPGAKGIVYPDGTIEGWIGGGCVRPVVLQESADSLADGRPRLVRMNAPPNAGSGEPTRHGDVREYPMTCQSEGGIEVYLEPVLAAPRLVLLGHTPVVQSLARLGSELGFEVVVASPAVPADLFPPGVRLASDFASALAGADPTTWVVIGTMGAGDEDALAAAARSDAAYIGLVASRKKARALLDYVGATGVPAEQLARVKYPAGLDLGGMGAAEIALSVLAEIVQRRYGKGSSIDAELANPSQTVLWPNGAPTRPAPMPVDPVCGMPVDPATARHTLVEDDHTLYFCCPHCKAAYARRQAASTT